MTGAAGLQGALALQEISGHPWESPGSAQGQQLLLRSGQSTTLLWDVIAASKNAWKSSETEGEEILEQEKH